MFQLTSDKKNTIDPTKSMYIDPPNITFKNFRKTNCFEG